MAEIFTGLYIRENKIAKFPIAVARAHLHTTIWRRFVCMEYLRLGVRG